MEEIKKKYKNKYLLLVVVCSCALLLASVESILLAIDATNYILVELVFFAAVWLGVFIYAGIFKRENKTKWNFTILILFLSWFGSFVSLGFSFLKCHYTSFETSVWEYIFPCVFRVSRYLIEFVDGHRVIVPGLAPRSVLYDFYFNWLISFIMCIGSITLYIKEMIRLKKKHD